MNFPPLPPHDSQKPLTLDTSVTSTFENGTLNPAMQKALPPSSQSVNSPARRPIILPGSPEATTTKPDDKDSPEFKKKVAMRAGPILEMQMSNATRYGMPESLFTSLKDIFESIIGHQSRTGVVSPHKFLEILRKENEMFRSAMHQDAHEFLNLLLNQVVDNVDAYSRLSPQLNGTINGSAEPDMAGAMAAFSKASNMAGMNGTGWVHDLFEGLLTSETRCLTCENTSQRDEAFMDLSVDLEQHSSVTSCLRKFSEEEMLCERNKFHCDNCGGLQEAEKRMKIKRLPKILALHLKRFKYTEDLQRLQKLFHRVVYPYHLRLFNTTDDAEDPDRLYELYAVVVHIGGGPYHGHYVSIIKTEDRGWLMFDDELVEPVDKSFVRNFFGGEPKPGVQDAKQLACAYVLFYQETTLEAVQKEMEAEGRATTTADSFVDGASPTIPNGLFTNGLRNTQTYQSPVDDEHDQFASLAHAATAPAVSPQPMPSLSTLQTSPFIPSGAFGNKLSRKETKQAEKERKAAEKEAEKQAKIRRKEEVEARRAGWRKQEEDLKAAIEASKTSKAEEDKRVAGTGGAAAVSNTPTTAAAAAPVSASNSPDLNSKEFGSGFTRFRPQSMSLRQKPKFWSTSKDKEALPAPAENAIAEGTATAPAEKDKEKEKEKDVKKNRFSLGRKKSNAGLLG